MAVSDRSLSKSLIPALTASLTSSAWRPLFGQRLHGQSGRTVASHQHPHWQFEWLLSGTAAAHVNDHPHALHADSGLLIAPGLTHDFHYTSDDVTWVSIKFIAPDFILGSDDGSLPTHAASRHIARSLAACVGPNGDLDAAVAPLLISLCALGLQPEPTTTDMLAHKIDQLVRHQPLLNWKVEEIAQRLHVSPGHCSHQFQRERGVALKTWLDQQRATACVRLLHYADASNADIAEDAGFPDVFTFSRFIKRVTGKSPSTWRSDPQR